MKAKKRGNDEHGRERTKNGKIEKKVIDINVSFNDSAEEIEKNLRNLSSSNGYHKIDLSRMKTIY